MPGVGRVRPVVGQLDSGPRLTTLSLHNVQDQLFNGRPFSHPPPLDGLEMDQLEQSVDAPLSRPRAHERHLCQGHVHDQEESLNGDGALGLAHQSVERPPRVLVGERPRVGSVLRPLLSHGPEKVDGVFKSVQLVGRHVIDPGCWKVRVPLSTE